MSLAEERISIDSCHYILFDNDKNKNMYQENDANIYTNDSLLLKLSKYSFYQILCRQNST
jgi:hypothetical protein